MKEIATVSLPLPLRIARRLRRIRSVRGGLAAMRALAPVYPSREFFVENDGITFRCDLTSYLEWNLAVFGDYEGAEKHLFTSLFPKSRRQVILDIGANIGIHSLSFSKLFQKVYCFEPNPAMYRRLKENLDLNSTAQIIPNMIGLGDTEATLTFYQPTEGVPNQGTGTFDKRFAPDRHQIIKLPVLRGDDFMTRTGIDRIDGIKIDVQGFEPQVLVGLADTIEASRPLIWIEISSATIDEINDRGGLSEILPDRYTIRKFVNRRTLGVLNSMRVEQCSDLRPDGEGNYLLVPSEWGK